MSKQIFYTTLASKFNDPSALYVELIFDSTPTFTKSIAPLLYDKKFSYGIRLDDGRYTAFTNVFAVLYGNNIPDEQNNVHNGIRSTDGCGNEVVWAGDFAMPTVSSTAHDDDQSANIRWSTLKFARDFGFGVMYHGHETPELNSIIPTYIGEEPNVYQPLYPNGNAVYGAIKQDIQNARNLIEQKLLFKPLVATVPGVAQEVRSVKMSDGTWRIPYLEEGMWCITGRKAGERLGDIVKSVPLSPGLNVNTIDSNWFIEPNWFPMPYHTTGNTNPGETLQSIKDGITEMSVAQGNYAKCFFTHDVTYDPNEGSNAGMTIQEFKELMEWIDTNYGYTSGKDEVWFASVQSVLEYIYCRLHTTVEQFDEGNRIILKIKPPAFTGMRRPALTFKINSNIAVKAINIHNIDKFSQNVLNSTSGIINVEWSGEHYAAAERMVTQLESSQSQIDKDYALELTRAITIPSRKDILLGRINAVVIVTQIVWLFDFGKTGTGYSSDPPYNMIGAPAPAGTSGNSVTTDLQFTNLYKTPNIGTVMVLTIGAGFKYGEGANYPGLKTASPLNRVINDGYFLDNALKDYFSVTSGTSAIITISGLKDNKKYDFAIISNRAYFSNLSKYEVYNTASTPFSNTQTVTCNTNPGTGSTYLDGNYDTPAIILNAIPYNGVLYLKVSSVTGTGYLNAMKITEHD
jgi:hypothetical protein